MIDQHRDQNTHSEFGDKHSELDKKNILTRDFKKMSLCDGIYYSLRVHESFNITNTNSRIVPTRL